MTLALPHDVRDVLSDLLAAGEALDPPEPGTGCEVPVEEPPLVCTYCLCPLDPAGLVGTDYRCDKHFCPSGGCVPIR